MILRPLLSEDSLKEAKRILLSKLKRMRDDASQYVVHQGLKYAGKDHALAISALGEEEILQKTTLEEIKEAHRALLEESGIENVSRYRMKSIPAAGALLRPEDSQEKQAAFDV